MLKKLSIVLSVICILFVLSSCKSSSKKDEAIGTDDSVPDIVTVDPTTSVSEIITGLIPTKIVFNDKVFFIQVESYLDLSKQIEGSTHKGFKVEKNTINCLKQDVWHIEKDNTIRKDLWTNVDSDTRYITSKYWYAIEADRTLPPTLKRESATSDIYQIASGGPIPENLTQIKVAKKVTLLNCHDKVGYVLSR